MLVKQKYRTGFEVAVRVNREQTDLASDFVLCIDEHSGKAEFQQGRDPTNFQPGSLKPTNLELNSLLDRLKNGRNLLEFRLISIQTKQIVSSPTWASIWCWEPSDRICVFDIDGTITKSDARGILSSVLQYENEGLASVPAVVVNLENHIHDGVIDVLSSISSRLNVLFLTARPITHEKILRSFLRSKHAPEGPLLTMSVRTQTSLTRSHREFKSDVLLQVKILFPPGSAPFAAGFGNQQSDVEAYHRAGIPDERIFLIDRSSRITVPRGQSGFGCSSYTELRPLLDAVCDGQNPLPAAPGAGQSLNCLDDWFSGILSGMNCCMLPGDADPKKSKSPGAPARRRVPLRTVDPPDASAASPADPAAEPRPTPAAPAAAVGV